MICNLQPTKHAKKADLNIHTYIDDVMKLLMQKEGDANVYKQTTVQGKAQIKLFYTVTPV